MLDEMKRTNCDYVNEQFINEQDQICRLRAIELFRIKVGKFEKLNSNQSDLINDINRWLEEKKVSNRERIKRKNIERTVIEKEREWEAARKRIEGN